MILMKTKESVLIKAIIPNWNGNDDYIQAVFDNLYFGKGYT